MELFETILETLPNEICKYLDLVDFVRLYLVTTKKIRSIIDSKHSFLKNVIKEVVVYENVKDHPAILYFIGQLRCKSIVPHLLKEGKVHILNLDCIRVIDGSITKVRDLTARSHTKTVNLNAGLTLNLRYTKMVDVSELGVVHSRDLTDTKVTDLSASFIYWTLNNSGTTVIDVSDLGKMHTLNLTNVNITDTYIIGSGKIHTINLKGTKMVGGIVLGKGNAYILQY